MLTPRSAPRRSIRTPAALLLGACCFAIGLAVVDSSTTIADEPIILPSEFEQIIPASGGSLTNALGPEGNIWYTGGNRIERVTESGIPTGDFPVPYGEGLGTPEPESYPSALSAGSDGAMWFIDNSWAPEKPPLLGRMSTTGKVAEYLVTGPGGYMNSLAAGPSAAIWFTGVESGGFIDRMTVKGTVERFTIPTGDASNLPVASYPGAITAGPDGDMWFIDDGVNNGGVSLVGRITPSGEIKEYPLSELLPYDGWITAGPGGYVWVASVQGTIYRIAVNGAVTKFIAPRAKGAISGIGAGPDGNLWYANEEFLGRITPSGQGTLFAPTPSQYWEGNAITGPEGDLWFSTFDALVALKPPLAPANVSPPVIGGEAVEGQELTASEGEWANDPTSFSRQWLLCDGTGSNCEALFGQSGGLIALLPGDVGHTLRLTVTADGIGGNATVTSSASAVVRTEHAASPDSERTLGSTVTAPATLGTTMTWKFGWSPRGTKITSLRLHGLPAGAEIEVRCRGRGCGFGHRRIRPLSARALRKCKPGPCLSSRGGEVELTPLWGRRRLHAHAVIEVIILRSGYKGKLFQYSTRQGNPPREPVIECLVPGSAERVEAC